MRKIVSGLFMALDGVVEAPNTWQEHFDEDMGEAMMAQLNSQDAVLLLSALRACFVMRCGALGGKMSKIEEVFSDSYDMLSQEVQLDALLD